MKNAKQMYTLALTVVVIVLVACVFLYVGHGIGRNSYDLPTISENDLFQIKVDRVIAKKMEEAILLARRDEHLRAAIALSELAGAEKALLARGKRGIIRDEVDEPSILEKTALLEYTLAGHREVYQEMLKLKYPDWKGSEGIKDDPIQSK